MAQILAPNMQCQMKFSKGSTSSMTLSPWTSIFLKENQKKSIKCPSKFRVCASLKSENSTVNRVEQLLNLDVTPYTDKIIAEYIWYMFFLCYMIKSVDEFRPDVTLIV